MKKLLSIFLLLPFLTSGQQITGPSKCIHVDADKSILVDTWQYKVPVATLPDPYKWYSRPFETDSTILCRECGITITTAGERVYLQDSLLLRNHTYIILVDTINWEWYFK